VGEKTDGGKGLSSEFPFTNPSQAKEIADEALNKFMETAESLGIRAFLVLGTCLGFFGIKGYIEDDDDLDLGVICNPLEFFDLVELLLKQGFTYRESHSHDICFVYKDIIFVDVWYFYPGMVIPYLKKLEKITYEGKQYNVPSPVEEYLKLQYGDWVIPCPEKRSGRYL